MQASSGLFGYIVFFSLIKFDMPFRLFSLRYSGIEEEFKDYLSLLNDEGVSPTANE